MNALHVRSALRTAIYALLLSAACEAETDPRFLQIDTPAAVAPPADNATTAAKAGLGRHLFYDRRLSINETRACATCHEQAKAFTDGFPQALGATGQIHRYNSPTLTNVVHRPTLTWQDPSPVHLEQQLLVPLLGQNPVEMGMAGQLGLLLDRLAQDQIYPGLFTAAFGTAEITQDKIAQALAAFERTLISDNSAFDKHLRGDDRALTEAEARGLELFFSARSGCSACHAGTDLDRAAGAQQPGFHNVGLYDIDGRGAYPSGAQGLFELTAEDSDRGKFRTPTLRNVALTGPYFHDGSVLDLRQAIQIHLNGGRNVTAGPRKGDGRRSPWRDPLLAPRELAPGEVDDLEAFLRSLTDEDFVRSAAFANPWP